MSRKRIEKNLAYDDGKRLFYVYFDYGRDAFGRRMRKTKTFSQELICKGWFLPPNTYDCGSFVVN